MKTHFSTYRQTSAFTLKELLVVMAIISILMVLLFAVLRQTRQSMNAAGCVSNLRQLYLAINLYANDHDNCYPRTYGKDHPDEKNKVWVTRLLDNGYIPKHSANIFYCPSTTRNASEAIYKRDPATWKTDYAVNAAVLTNTAANNNRLKFSANHHLLYDGAGAGGGLLFQRHSGHGNILFVGGHVEKRKSLPTQ